MTTNRRNRLLVSAVLLAAAATPFLFDDYSLFQFGRVICIGIAVISLDLLTGHAGQISAGHGALFGLGAYTSVILIHHHALPYPAALMVGVALCFVVGLLLGLPALRIKGLSLGLVTLALATLFPAVLKSLSGLTGGVFGLGIQPPQAPAGLPLTSGQWLYLLDLAALAVVLLLMSNLVQSRFGFGLAAIRTNEDMAASVGINVPRSKVLAFALSSALAGFAGGLYQLSIGTATPDTFTFTLSLSLLFAAVVGGLRSRLGSLIGAAFVIYVPDYTATLGDRGPQLVYALALLLVVYLMPGGIAGMLRRRAEGLLAIAGRAAKPRTGSGPIAQFSQPPTPFATKE